MIHPRITVPCATAGLIRWGMPEESARTTLLLLMVLFENVRIGNCRCETQSAFTLSPFRSPILLTGTLIAFLLHVTMLYLPLGRRLLQTEPVSLTLWLVLAGLALTVFVAIELHKLLWAHRRRTVSPSLR